MHYVLLVIFGIIGLVFLWLICELKVINVRLDGVESTTAKLWRMIGKK